MVGIGYRAGLSCVRSMLYPLLDKTHSRYPLNNNIQLISDEFSTDVILHLCE